MVAARIHQDIVRQGWPVGKVLGSEAGLLARYRISRAVFREAVRLLEYHAVARMRRGPGGGLIVAQPEPQASIETMALYLEYRQVTAEDLRMVREAIELGTVAGVVARRDDPQVAARLGAAARWAADGPPAGTGPADLFHTELAQLGGNPVLVLFLRILSELSRRHTARQNVPVPPARWPVRWHRLTSASWRRSWPVTGAWPGTGCAVTWRRLPPGGTEARGADWAPGASA